MKIKKKSLLSPKVFNYLYSIGAAIVILGALFKLLHVKGADLVLIIGMGTEAIIFFISAFDEPAKEPNWENVFPGIYDNKTLTAEEKALLEERRAKHEAAVERAAEAPIAAGGGTIIIGGSGAGGDLPIGNAAMGMPSGTTIIAGGGSTGNSAVLPGASSLPAGSLTPDQADQVSAATEKYVSTLNEISASLGKLQMAMSSLGDSNDYAQQMAALNRNIQGLNTIYEIQLKSVSSQLSTIEEVNRGLNNIRSLYENGQNDSFKIRQESDQLARNLQQLNEVYARMLQAMTAGKN